ncbi:3-oxoacyl-reductase [Conidiobolus coronatus NRRL 28638]|uniref:3-oxoacyl-reductase n=1 Tax=Conidiobolus coronatus (strain ATCC 28846 / CBS 209.66 / NRRL 28638) TaxID=796925 RepID=A0A137PA71_CONC2|nr:3-oxoacyl-reductase [Conidiobolus coronatus NRRL 28638]|eukprot:KXN71905.1 3-oxoacyl-reductase [Conidiobolus coronatus NRRL 28638]
MGPLKNKLCLVTGGSKGIGLGISKKLAQMGGRVVLLSRSDQVHLAKEQLPQLNSSEPHLSFNLDVSNPSQVEQLFKDLKEQELRASVLVNAAGIVHNQLLTHQKSSSIQDIININLLGTTYMCKSMIKQLVRNKEEGNIINLSSITGIFGNPGNAVYSSTKAGIIGLTKSLAKEWGSKNIRVNCIAPGYINTDMTSGLPAEYKEKIMESVPLKRWGTVEDVAQAAEYLTLANYANGVVLQVDGGLSL